MILKINGTELAVTGRSSVESIYVSCADREAFLNVWEQFTPESIRSYTIEADEVVINGYGADMTGIVLTYQTDGSMVARFDIRQETPEEQLQDTIDKLAPSVMDSVPDWDGNSHAYQAGDLTKYDGVLYKVRQAHTSQDDWRPDTVPALYESIYVTPASTYPEWKQPTGAHDAYAIGSKVTHNNKLWESEADNNVWEPGVYGWTEVNHGI